MKGEALTHLDMMLIEMFSFQLYKKGKKPLEKIEPRTRIRKGIWNDDGVDIDELQKAVKFNTDIPSLMYLFKMSTTSVRKGILRKKTAHRICREMNDLEDVKVLSEGFEAFQYHRGWQTEIVSSELLHPFLETRTAEKLRSIVADIEPSTTTPQELPDISPQAVFRYMKKERGLSSEGDDLSSLFDRKVKSEEWVKVSRTELIKDLASLIDLVLKGSEKDLKGLLESGAMVRFTRVGLKSPYLEGFWSQDMLYNEDGIDSVRSRFGRFIMEGPLSERTYDELVLPRLEQFLTCSPKQASKLESELGHVMDTRSSKYLQEMVFKAPPKNRSPLIRLLGLTGDRNASSTLKKLMEFSAVDEDRKAAKKALKELGGQD